VYAQRLIREGFPAQLVTFGQPKVLRRDHADRYKQLPCVRVLDVKDPIPHHFAGFVHVGTEVVFMNATDVSVSAVPGAWRRRRRDGNDGSASGDAKNAKGSNTNAKGTNNAKGSSSANNAKATDKDKAGRGGGLEDVVAEGVIEKSVVFNDIDHYLRLIRQKNRMTGNFRRSHIFTAKNSII